MTRILILSLIVALGPCIALGANAGPATFWTGNPADVIGSGEPPIQTPLENLSLDVGDPVDFDAALTAGADYLKGMQADITEDNAGNGTDGVDESPDDPDDGGWDWRVTSPPAPFSHTTTASSTNLYGVTVMGLYSAYLESGDATHFTAMQDAADRAVAAGVDSIRTGADLKFLMLFNDLYSSEVAPTTVYEDAAKAKYDGKITAWGGSATALAEYIRDARAGQGYENGIIAWDIGIYAVVAQMLYDRFGGTYDVDADDISEVLWQDSYNDNPGYFDIVDDAGWDPTYATYDYYWYSLGITGLIDAFSASGAHTSELSGLLTILFDCQYTGGGISFSYGANTDDEDWQSTAYAMISLGNYDQATYQMEINWMGYWLGATQDASGGWVYSSGNHYPEVGGECTHGLHFTSNTLADVIVDDDFTSQADVDAYNTANGTDYVWGYDAFATIQDGIDGVTGSTVNVAAGIYREQLYVDHSLDLLGAGVGISIIEAPDPVDRTTYPVTQWTSDVRTIDAVIGVVAAGTVNISGFTVDGRDVGPDNFYGIHFFDTDGSVTYCTIDNITNAAAPSNSRVVSVAATHSLGQTFTIDISNNAIPVLQKGGILVMGPGASFTVNHNTVTNTPSPVLAGNGIQLSYGASGSTLQNIVAGTIYSGDDWAATGILLFESGDVSMVGDEVYNCQSGVNFSDWGWVHLQPSPVILSFTDLNLHENEWTLGIQLSRDNSDVNMTVTDCDILNSTGDGIDLYCTGVDPWGGSYYTGWNNGDLNATITGCYVNGSTLDGIWGGDYSGNVNNVAVSVSNCGFAGNTGSAINNGFTQLMDASGCYWNDPTGPTIGVKSGGMRSVAPIVNPFGGELPAKASSVSTELIGADKGSGETIFGNVDYTPWLGGGAQTSPGFAGDFATLYVDDDSPQAGATTRIQEGVDLVSGSTVYVKDGIYGADPVTGRGVYITNDGLSLIGESQAGTIIDGAIGGVGSSGSYWSRGIHVQANNVTIQNFTVQGFTGDLVSSGGYGVLHRDYAHDTPTEGYIFYDGCSVNHVTVHSCYSVVYALCFTNLTVADCYLHDNYSDGMFIARGSDGAIIHDNIVTNSGDQGIWVGKCWSGLDPSDNATIYDNTVNGAREGGICFVGSDVAEIYGNSITNAASEGWSVGALNLKDGPTNVNAYENRIFNNDGAWNGYSGLGHGVGIDGGAGSINLYDNAIFGNTGLGVYNASTKASSGMWETRLIEDELPSTPEHMTSGSSDKGTRGLIMAEDNWWGSFDGPEDLTGTDEATLNTCFDVSTMINAIDELGNGLGNGVSDDVDYCPWASGLYLSPDEILYHCSGNFTFDAGIDVAVTDMKVGAFKFEYDMNITYVNVTTSLTGDVILQHQVVGSNPTRTKDTLFVDIGFGSGESLDGPATLFTVEMNSNTDFCNGTPIDMFYALVKDINDDPITLPLPVPINLIADCEDPDVWVNAPAEDVHYNTAPILDIEAYDNCDLDAVYYQVDGCGGTWISIATGLSGQSYNNIAWTFPDFGSVSEGQHCIYFRVTDDATRENFDKCDADSAWCFVKDTENPEPSENFTALPGHNKVLLSWDASPSGDVVRYQIQRIGWADYPLYGLPAPSYPLDPTVGTTVYNDDGLDTTDTQGLENATRDIYYYSIFAFDAAGNYSANVNPPTPGTGTRDRATSYWLGDIAGGLPPTHGDFDGFVYFADLDFFTLTYYLSTGDTGFDPHSDIGPTVAGSAGGGPDKARGIPEPDGAIDINDLWIFATNFNTVDDSKLRKPVLVVQPVPNNTGLRIVQRHDGHDLRVELYLDNAANNVKLLEAEISFDMSMLAYNGADQLISASSGNVPVFFHATDRKDKVYITAGALGSNVTFEGSGLIADVRFSLISEGPARVSLTGVTLRDADNNEIVPDVIPTDDLEGSGDESSLTYDLKQNVPNPFNPTTTISYSVPTGTHVSVKVYNVMGQLVKTLVDDYRSAGRHEITWHGRNEAGEDAASGVYFYRFQTSEYSKTVKMTLVK